MTWLGIVCALYLCLSAAVYLLQDKLIFVGAGQGDRPLDAMSGVTVETLVRPGGERFRVAVGSVEKPVGVMVFFLGNGEDLRSGVHWASRWLDYGVEAVVVEYPGYGASEGRPGKASFFMAAEVAAEFAAARARAKKIPFFAGGNSIGTFCAVQVAAAAAPTRLVMYAPPADLASIAAGQFWWLPVRLLLRHNFDNVALAAKVSCPVFIMHGDLDGVVAQRSGRLLADALPGEVQFVSAVGHGHNDLPVRRQERFGDRIAAFLTDH